MADLKMKFMPKLTQDIFQRLQSDKRLAPFTLVGGTALALQLGHRVSEDLDFNLFGKKLPLGAIDGVLEDWVARGARIESLITHEQKTRFKINTSENLDHYLQDYSIDGAKVTFQSRVVGERPQKQIDYLLSAQKHEVCPEGFKVLSLEGLFVMKSIVVYDRVKSRDLYDLMTLLKDQNYTLDDIFSAIKTYQPLRNNDPEHFKRVVTGTLPLDQDDEGFNSIELKVKMPQIYNYFKKLIDAHEIKTVQELKSSPD